MDFHTPTMTLPTATKIELDPRLVEIPIVEHLRARARERPDQPAVEGRRHSFTYRELDGLTDQVAGSVLDRESGLEHPVAVLVDHDALLPAAMLGVQRAGGWVVPLDSGDALERTIGIVEDAGARLIVTDGVWGETARLIARRVGAKVVDAERLDRHGAMPVEATLGPSTAAAIFYTSGSSGRPKGVCHSHRSLLHTPLWFAAVHAVGPGDRLSMLLRGHSIGSHVTLWGGLAAGATVCLFDVRNRDLAALADWIDEQRLSVYHSVPTLFRRLMRGPARGRRFETPRVVRFGGEPVTRTEWNL